MARSPPSRTSSQNLPAFTSIWWRRFSKAGCAAKPCFRCQKACTGSYRHAGYLFLFSPSGEVDAVRERTYRIELADEVPAPRNDGRPMYWVYPGTTLIFSVPAAWDPAWGEVRLDLAGRVMDFDEFPVTVKAPGFSEELRSNGNFDMSHALESPTGAWSVEIASPAGGPYLVIDTLTIGNPDNAVVMTSEAAWVK